MLQKIRLDTDTQMMMRRELSGRMVRTPDLPQLMEEGDQLVFVYGTLKQGFHNHSVIDKHADYLGKARTLRQEYEMYDTGGFPVVLNATKTAGDFVYGELYSVDPRNMMALDSLESNGSMYTRERVRFKLLEQNGAIREAWIYIGCDDYWDAARYRLHAIGRSCPVSPTNPGTYMPSGLLYKDL